MTYGSELVSQQQPAQNLFGDWEKAMVVVPSLAAAASRIRGSNGKFTKNGAAAAHLKW